MGPNVIILLKILVLCSLIGQCVSSIFLTFGQKLVHEEHHRLKNSNVHRGMIFSLTATQRNEICQDYFSTQLYTNPDAATKLGNENSKDLPIQIMRRWVTQAQVKARVEAKVDVAVESVFDELDVTLVCVAKGFKSRAPPNILNYISPTFRTKWFYGAHVYSGRGAPPSQYVSNFVVLSPDQVSLQRAELEKRYWNTRQIIATLREESQKYVELIERRDNLSTLSKKQKLNICAGILSSPAYRQDRLEYSASWINESYENEENLDEVVQISFDDTKEKLETDGIFCKAFEDGMEPESPSTNMYLTRSYANGYSAVVLKEINSAIVVDKYFENIAELITVHEEMNYHKLFVHTKVGVLQIQNQ